MGGVNPSGGSLVLATLIDRAGEALFQDFQDVYGLNLIHMVRDDVPPLEILLLIRGLKPGSRFVSELQGSPEYVGWDVLQYQIASLIDAVNYTTYVVTAANSKKKPKAPKPAYRPKKAGQKPNNAFRTQLEMSKKRKLAQAKGG